MSNQIFFVLLMAIPEMLFLPAIWPIFKFRMHALICLIVVLPYIFLMAAAFDDPGIITKENHSFMEQIYPFDYKLYHPGHICSTCKLVKVSFNMLV